MLDFFHELQSKACCFHFCVLLSTFRSYKDDQITRRSNEQSKVLLFRLRIFVWLLLLITIIGDRCGVFWDSGQMSKYDNIKDSVSLKNAKNSDVIYFYRSEYFKRIIFWLHISRCTSEVLCCLNARELWSCCQGWLESFIYIYRLWFQNISHNV